MSSSLYQSFYNVALEEAVLQTLAFEKSERVVLRIWENNPSVVLGRTQNRKEEIAAAFKHSLNWKRIKVPDYLSEEQPLKQIRLPFLHKDEEDFALIRRASGGGSVIHGPGILSYSLFIPIKKYPWSFQVQNSYKKILGLIIKALQTTLALSTESNEDYFIEMSGLSDLVIRQSGLRLKFSGNAQYRSRNILCHHGTLIIKRDFIDEAFALLSHPGVQPEYRNNREHKSFIAALPEIFRVNKFVNNLLGELNQDLLVNKTIKEDQDKIYFLNEELINKEDKFSLKDLTVRTDYLKDLRLSLNTDLYTELNTEFYNKINKAAQKLLTEKYSRLYWLKGNLSARNKK